MPNEPVISCLSLLASPNLLEPDEKMIDDDIYVTFNSVAFIVPPTLKFPVIVSLPVMV